MTQPVTVPAIGLRRATAKNIVTSNGRLKTENHGKRKGSDACKNRASSGISTAAMGLNRNTSIPSRLRDLCAPIDECLVRGFLYRFRRFLFCPRWLTLYLFCV